MVAVLYFLFSRLRGEVLTFSGRVQAHLGGLGTAIFLLLALGHWLGRYDLLYSTSGAVVGVGYTEANAGLPVHYLMTGVAIFSGIPSERGDVFFRSPSDLLGHRLVVGAGHRGWFSAAQGSPAIICRTK